MLIVYGRLIAMDNRIMKAEEEVLKSHSPEKKLPEDNVMRTNSLSLVAKKRV